MARMVAAPTASLFGKGLFGTLSQNTVSYLQGQIGMLANASTEYGQRIFEKSMNIFNAINSDAAVMSAEIALSQIESMSGQDMIECLNTIAQLQTAASQMQGWIMTDPTIRQAYFDGKIEGYSDTYIDHNPGLIGHEDPNYRLQMNGVFVPHEDASWQYSLYGDRADTKDGMLTLRQLAAIVETQEAARYALEAGDLDPTSQYGASL